VGYYFIFVSPDVEKSGAMASYAIFATFLTANKTNSIAAFFFGIPFERMIPYHNLSSLATVVLFFSMGMLRLPMEKVDQTIEGWIREIANIMAGWDQTQTFSSSCLTERTTPQARFWCCR
jgi:hypothetical protein